MTDSVKGWETINFKNTSNLFCPVVPYFEERMDDSDVSLHTDGDCEVNTSSQADLSQG